MEIKVNGTGVCIAEHTSLTEYLAERRLTERQIVVEYNETILPRERWKDTILCPQDRLEIVTFVGGG